MGLQALYSLFNYTYVAEQAAKAQSATAGLEAATARKLMAEFRASITAQVEALQQRQGTDAAALVKVRCLPCCPSTTLFSLTTACVCHCTGGRKKMFTP